MKKYNSIEKAILRELDEDFYSPVDVIKLEVSYRSFTDIGNIHCSKSIKEFSDVIRSVLSKNKHPTLNPLIDHIHEFIDENESKDPFEEFVLRTGLFMGEKVDNKKQYLSITIFSEVLAINARDFIEDERIEITKAEVQTALFKRLIDA